MNLESSTWIWTKKCSLPSDMSVAHSQIGEVMGEVRTLSWNDKDIFAIELALEEAFTNAIQHGNESDTTKSVHFECKLSQNKICVRVEDEGKGFDPSSIADPRDPENQMIPSGRGVLLIKHFVTKVEWNERGNVIEFEKDRS